jgi:large subunit ribosomal protein L25
MEPQTLQAEVRQKGGKGPARQLRTRGLIPAIYYGPGTEPVKLSVSPHELAKALSGSFARNQTIELSIGGAKHLAVVRDLAIDPLSRELRHADFYAVAKDRKVDAVVPFEITGRALGVQKGGAIRKPFRTLPVRAFPQDIPAKVVLDVSPFDIGTIITVKDLPLPKGVEVTYAPERRVLFVDAKERKKRDLDEETPAAGAPAAGAAPAAAAAAKPAKG